MFKNVGLGEVLIIGTLLLLLVAASELNAQWAFKGTIKDEIKCLAYNIYHEARGQNEVGQWAIAHVTWNRVQHNNYPNSICDVVWQKSEHRKSGRIVAQFSWTLDGKSDKPRDRTAYALARTIAVEFLSQWETIEDPTGGATHYHADYVNPYWAKHLDLLAKVDNHIFYR